MIIYCDGGSYPPQNLIAWGIRIEHGDGAEVCGWRKVKQHQHGCHEMIAFIEAVIYAHTHGAEPESCHFYTDDQCVVFGTQYQNVNSWDDYDSNCFSPALNKFLELVRPMYSAEVLQTVCRYLRKARFTWVKGHASTVNNCRADYLASVGASLGGNGTPKVIIPYDKWMINGFSKYTGSGTHRVWFPPFVGDRNFSMEYAQMQVQ